MLANTATILATLAFVVRNSLIVTVLEASTFIVVTYLIVGATAFVIVAAPSIVAYLIVPSTGARRAPIYLAHTFFYSASIYKLSIASL